MITETPTSASSMSSLIHVASAPDLISLPKVFEPPTKQHSVHASDLTATGSLSDGSRVMTLPEAPPTSPSRARSPLPAPVPFNINGNDDHDHVDENDHIGDHEHDDDSTHLTPELASPVSNKSGVDLGGSLSREGSPSPFPMGLQQLPFSLLDYLKEEIRATEMNGFHELKTERVTNFLSVPLAVEKCILFGFVICLDSFLYTFTILPLRFLFAWYHLIRNRMTLDRRKRHRLAVSHQCDLAKGILFLVSCAILHRITDASQMYHSVRGQETLKLYVIFNVLEIADRLCCSFGQDLFDSLFSRSTFGQRHDGSQPNIRPLGLFALCVLYTLSHTLVLFYQLVTLNVAINYWSNALITLLLSNQFVEIKGAVFKKFEKENLFQMTCADIVERFQLAMMLSVIALRNLIEISGSTFTMLPASYIPLRVIPSLSALQSIFSPAFIVLCSEMLVDWLKHAFITKFNHIRPSVYGRFTDVLCKDLLVDQHFSSTGQAFVDQSPIVSRRIGLAALPMGCLVVRVVYQALNMLTDASHIDECAPPRSAGLSIFTGLLHAKSADSWISDASRSAVVALVAMGTWAGLIMLKLLLGINLRVYASYRVASMAQQTGEDQLNSRNRPPLAINEAEQAAEQRTRSLLLSSEFDAPGKISGRLATSHTSSLDGHGIVPMEMLSRYDMIKSRVW